jgi:hypothetical protein
MKAAAGQGHADAMGGVGYFFSKGIAVKKDEREAVIWFRKGADKGSPKAMLNLAKMLLANKGVDAGNPDRLAEEGLQWMAKAADAGLPEALLAYGSVFYFGDHGMARDEAKAATYLKPAADSGLPEAQNMIGVITETGNGLPMDANASKEWFRKAAMAGNAKAQANLGRVLGPLNEDRATRIESIAWLIVASGKGEVTASKLIEESLAGFRPGEFDDAKQRADELRKVAGGK